MELEYKFSPKSSMTGRECSDVTKCILLNPNAHVLESSGQLIITKYFDDANFSLTKQKIAVRERTSVDADFTLEDFDNKNFFINQSKKLQGKGFKNHTLSFKWGGSAEKGLHIRQEVEMDFADRDFSLLDEKVEAAYNQAVSHGLEELFETVIYRYAIIVEYVESRIEFVVDFGYYSNGKGVDLNSLNHRNLIMEYELELKNGTKEDLINFSERLREELDLIPNEKSKFQRGIELYF
ncbi:CYTH domain-containing protein [Eubacteriales bacterium KG127]